MEMIEELYDYLETDPGNVMTRELILDAWIQLDNQEMASGIAKEIQRLDPSNESARTYFRNRGGGGSRHASAQAGPSHQEQRGLPSPPATMKGKKTIIRPVTMPRTEQERSRMEKSFTDGYKELRAQAESLLGEMRALQTVGRIGDDTILEDLQSLIDGRLSAVISRQAPRPVRELAREIIKRKPETLDIIIADFEEVVEWIQAEDPQISSDAVRKRLLQRQALLEAAIPTSLVEKVGQALTHVEHERLRRLAGGRTYANAETMLGDDVADIPRANLLVTEDNHAWDMSELAAALEANSGVMRNPLTRAMFTPDDVRRVLRHPLGARLAPLRLEQDQLKKGVRRDTIDRLARLSATMLADQTPDAAPSMVAVDEFLSYVAGLPASEQKTLDELKIPATDSHTALAFDYTIGESVRDAKANRTCFHKTGDFLGQAARYLGRS